MQYGQEPLWKAIVWTLRATVALQCLGNAWWFLRIEETPLLSLLWGQPDVGGLGWSEAAALGVQHALGWGVIAAALVVLVRPCTAVLVPAASLELILALAAVRMQGEYQLPWGWVPESFAALFPLFTQAARVAAPVGLMFLDPWTAKPLATRRVDIGIAILRVAIVLTYFGHGIEAWTHYPRFVDYNILAVATLTGWHIAEGTSRALLTVMGAIDFAVAISVATSRWQPAIGYMIFWGLVTSLARLVVHGWDLGWHEFATRAPHFGLPLAIALYWFRAEWGGDDAIEKGRHENAHS